MNQLRFALRMVKPRRALYNALTLATVLALVTGCGGKPTPPPPRAGEKMPPADVELGDESSSPAPATGEPTPNSSPDDKPPADGSGTK